VLLFCTRRTICSIFLAYSLGSRGRQGIFRPENLLAQPSRRDGIILAIVVLVIVLVIVLVVVLVLVLVLVLDVAAGS